MSANHVLPDQIRCLALDATRMTVLEGGAVLPNVIVEVADDRENPWSAGGEPVLVSLTPLQARELASSLSWQADRSERIAAGRR